MIKNYIKLLDKLSDKRKKHILSTIAMAKLLSVRYGVDEEKASLAALFHDIAREDDLDEKIRKYGLDLKYIGKANLSHSKVAAIEARQKYGIEDDDIINAISYHTTGRAGMSHLEKVVFLADAIEEGRTYPGVDNIRKEAAESLDKGCLASLKNTEAYLKMQGLNIDEDTVKAIKSFERSINWNY